MNQSLSGNKDIRHIADTYGLESQLRQLQEECAELIVAVSKSFKAEKTMTNLFEEIADVEIMIAQIKYLTCSNGQVDAWIQRKIERQLQRIKSDTSCWERGK